MIKQIPISYLIIGVLILYIGYVRACEIPDMDTTVVTETTSDATIDSLETQVSYWKNLKPDTVRVYVDVPVPTPTDDTAIQQYKSSYSDSVIVARWTQQIEGQLKSQVFEYAIKRQFVTEKTKLKTITNTITKTTTITNTLRPKGYVSIGGFVGVINDKATAGPSIAYTNKTQTTFFVNYDALNQGFVGGVRVKLKLF